MTLGWNYREGSQTPSELAGDIVGFRWSADAQAFEARLPGFDWGRLRLAFPGSPNTTGYQVIAADGRELPVSMTVTATGTIEAFRRQVSLAYWSRSPIDPGQAASGSFAFGIPTASGDVPNTGLRTYRPAPESGGDAELTFDFAAGTLSGYIGVAWVDAWGPYPATRYGLATTAFGPGSRTFSASFTVPGAPSPGHLEGMFFGPQARGLAIRWRAPIRNPYTGDWETTAGVWIAAAP